MTAKTNTIFRQCAQCKKDVVISYECPSCKLRICLICAIENDWGCPHCHSTLV
jgi:hypothetical protein